LPRSRRRTGDRCTDHRIAGDTVGKPLLAPAFSSGRAHWQHQVPQLSIAVPDAHLGLIGYREAEFCEHASRIAHEAGTVGRRFVPNWRQAECRPRIAGAEGADHYVVHLGRVLDHDHVLALRPANAEFGDRRGRVLHQPGLVGWISPGTCHDLRAVTRSDPSLDQFSGDGIMVFFNDPVPCPDPAERAVRMAMAMREAAGELIASWRRRRGRVLGFGVGIAQGYATLGQIGFAERSGYTAIGTVCNLAARLCAEAKDGQILLAQRVAVAVEENTPLEEVGALTLKGLTQPVVAYNVPLAVTQPALRVIEGGPPSV